MASAADEVNDDVEYEFHEFANLFPMMESQEWEDFKKDVEANGVRDKIVLFKDKILDGRNRYKAAKELGIGYGTEIYSGDDPLSFVISHNLHRRQLTDKQRVEIAAKMANLTNGQHAAKGAPPIGGAKKTSVKQAAGLMNVSVRATERERAKQKAEASEVPALKNISPREYKKQQRIYENTSVAKQKPPKPKVSKAERARECVKEIEHGRMSLNAAMKIVFPDGEGCTVGQRSMFATKIVGMPGDNPTGRIKWPSKPLTHERYSGDNWELDESYAGLLRQYKDQSFEFEELENTLLMTIEKLHRRSISLKRERAELKREIEKMNKALK